MELVRCVYYVYSVIILECLERFHPNLVHVWLMIQKRTLSGKTPLKLRRVKMGRWSFNISFYIRSSLSYNFSIFFVCSYCKSLVKAECLNKDKVRGFFRKLPKISGFPLFKVNSLKVRVFPDDKIEKRRTKKIMKNNPQQCPIHIFRVAKRNRNTLDII